MKLRLFCIGLLVAVALVILGKRIYWHFFTTSLKLTPLGQGQTCFREFVAVLDEQNLLSVYDRNMTRLIGPRVSLTPDKTLELTAFDPPCLKFPGKACIRKFIQAPETPCQSSVLKFQAKTKRETHVFKILPGVELSTTLRKVKKSIFGSKEVRLTVQSGGTSMNFPIKDNVNDPISLRASDKDDSGFWSNRIALQTYTYVKGSLVLDGIVLGSGVPDIPKIDGNNPVLAKETAHLPPLCLRGFTPLKDIIRIRTADRRTFSLTIEFMTLNGKFHVFDDEILNDAVSFETEIESSQYRVTLSRKSSLWTGQANGLSVSLREDDCERDELDVPTLPPLIDKGSLTTSKTGASIEDLKCIAVAGSGMGLIVSKSTLLIHSKAGYRLVPIPAGSTPSDCPSWVTYPRDWKRLEAAYQTIQGKCVKMEGHSCKLNPNFSATCGTDNQQIFVYTGEGYFRVQLRQYRIYSIKENNLEPYTTLKSCL